MRRLAIALVFVASFATAFGQDMTPPKQVTDLGWMIGTWSGAGTFSFGGQDMDVSMTMVVSFDGQFVKTVSTSDMGGMKMSETMMLGWDDAKSEYTSYTFTSFAPTPGIKHGKMEGDKLVMVSEPWSVHGQSVVSRSTFTKLGDGKFGSAMELKNGEKWDKAMAMELTKK